MRASLVATLTAGMLLGADAAHDGLTKKDHERMQGKWDIVTVEFNGVTEDLAEAPTPIEIKGHRLHFPSNPEVSFRFKLDAAYQPRLMDLVICLDKKVHNLHEGIYALEVDTLRICYVFTPNKKERPLTFTAPANAGRQCLILKRVR